jgi:hypothetical protein
MVKECDAHKCPSRDGLEFGIDKACMPREGVDEHRGKEYIEEEIVCQ